MSKKLTITITDEVYANLHRWLGRRRISHFINEIAHEHLVARNSSQYWLFASKRELDAAYKEQAAYEAAHADELKKNDEIAFTRRQRRLPQSAPDRS
jgi:predicted CopG family antitoxin